MKREFPEVIVFDVDGVLVDVRLSFLKSVLDTVRFFTGKRVTWRELYRWKAKPGFNDDWKTSHAWVTALGFNHSFEEVKTKFQEFYWGKSFNGNVAKEKWLLSKPLLRRLSKRSELCIFTGRNRQELDHTLDRLGIRPFFKQIVTADDVAHGKPDPEGLLRILHGRSPDRAVYVGDNIDDAVAAQRADVPFIGLLVHRSQARRHGRAQLLELGAQHVLGDIKHLEHWLHLPPHRKRFKVASRTIKKARRATRTVAAR